MVTSPIIDDFYSEAHASLNGTPRPTYYVVVVDENKYTAGKLQGLVKTLCFSNARATPFVPSTNLIVENIMQMISNDDL
ncbi:hypothetical protein I350_06394 [Cryptococcus amylolentus CBS 6273]|uniref:Piwi domain-containing protein n=1 Tax=Cryptococcus amylolentus CBS 6273 TaxID=1296118 RepID=A0A1E3JL36_9TREE|nr:hypothetical protein I350_06394 [Cryptococcus amylolentus CBS 6273]